jgi:hypothetical protein
MVIIAPRIPMMVITTRSSMRVNADWFDLNRVEEIKPDDFIRDLDELIFALPTVK